MHHVVKNIVQKKKLEKNDNPNETTKDSLTSFTSTNIRMTKIG